MPDELPDLLPCPFCARMPSLHVREITDPPSGMYVGWQAHVQCMCGGTVGVHYLYQTNPSARSTCMVETIERWNLRKKPKTPKPVAPVAVSQFPVARCFWDDDGVEHATAVIYGYSIGDKLLDGVNFLATLRPDKHLSVTVDPDHLAFFAKLNMQEWTDMALSWALTDPNEIFAPVEGDGDLLLKDPVL